MSLETAGNIAALFGGALKGYQDQTEIELKKKQLERDEELKRLQIEAGLLEKGLTRDDKGVWGLSPEERQKRDLDALYKQSQMELNKARGEYYKEGGQFGGELKAALGGFTKDPLGNLVETDYLKQKRAQELAYQKAQMDKTLGNVKVPEAESVAEKNKIQTTIEEKKLYDAGLMRDPKNRDNFIPRPNFVRPPTKLEEEKTKKYLDQGLEWDYLTGKTKKIVGWKSKEAQQSEKDAKEDAKINRQQTTELRKEFLSLPSTKDMLAMDISLKKLTAAAQNASGADDIAIVFNFMKLQDPSSTVREGEYANAQQASGVSDKVISQYNKLIDGQTLTPAQRKMFVESAGKTYNAALDAYSQMGERYKGLAKKGNIAPEDVVPEYKKYIPSEFTDKEKEALD